MAIEMTSVYFTTVGSDRTIVLPDEMPVGATVAVIIMPTGASQADDAARRARFAETLSAIRAASAQEAAQSEIADGDLDALIETARKAPRA